MGSLRVAFAICSAETRELSRCVVSSSSSADLRRLEVVFSCGNLDKALAFACAMVPLNVRVSVKFREIERPAFDWSEGLSCRKLTLIKKAE